MSRPVASFPHLGNYAVVIKDLAQLVDCEVMLPPPITRRTLELGANHSPEFVCVPFKYNLGNFIEALDAGTDVLIQAGGGCRYSYYGEVQETILRDMGYEFGFVQISSALQVGKIASFVRRYNPKVRRADVIRVLNLVLEKVRALDEIEDTVRKRVGFEVQAGSFEGLLHLFLEEIEAAETKEQVLALRESYRTELDALPIDRPDDCMKVGVIGEFYVVLEPFSNMSIEKYLAARGVEVHRFCSVTSTIDHAVEGRANLDRLLRRTAPYVRHHVGAEGTMSVYKTLECMDEGFDGMVHLKPFG
jgi:predicted nucleotide-binding protein (sugar kinase/HSP70/actin superfamily)